MPDRVDEQSELAESRDVEAETLPGRLYRRRTDRIQTSAQIIVATAVVLAICYVAKPVLIVLLVSILLAFMLTPIVDGLQRVRVPRSVGAVIALLVLLAIFYGMTYFFYNRAIGFVHDLPKYTERIQNEAGKLRQQTQRIRGGTETLPSSRSEGGGQFQRATDWASSLSPSALTQGAGAVWEVALTVSFVPFLVYFMLTWQEHARAATVMLFRLEHRNAAYVTLGRISAMIRSFLVGNLLMGIFLSVVSTVAFAALHLPYFYFVGFISGFVSLIPYLGLIIAVLPPLAAGAGQLHGGGILVILITVLGLHVFAINVFYPKLIGKRLQLNPLVVTISLLIWGWIWGAAGLVLAVPVTAALKIIFDHIESLRPYGAWLGE
jgi:predicted PurR-regulated permease PerM